MGFKDEHCTEETTKAEAIKFVHEVISLATFTRGTNNQTGASFSNAVFSTTIAGVAVEIVCTVAESTGKLENVKGEEVGEVKGSGIVDSYSSCTVAKPAGKGCTVAGGAITSAKLKSSTPKEKALIKYEPEEGKKVATITIEGCSLKGSYEITGSFDLTPSGATYTTTPASSESLKLGTSNVSLECLFTERMATEAGHPENPISYTRVFPL